MRFSLSQIIKETSLLYCLPNNPFFGGQKTGHAVQEASYAYAAWIFSQHFCNRLGTSYIALKGVLDEDNAVHAEVYVLLARLPAFQRCSC